MTIEQRRELVLATIERIELAVRKWRDTEANAEATSADRERARLELLLTEREFGRQWQNVKEILSEGGTYSERVG